MISPHTNLFSKSELDEDENEDVHQLATILRENEGVKETHWMTPAAWGAFVPLRIVHARTSSAPAVKYRISWT